MSEPTLLLFEFTPNQHEDKGEFPWLQHFVWEFNGQSCHTAQAFTFDGPCAQDTLKELINRSKEQAVKFFAMNDAVGEP